MDQEELVGVGHASLQAARLASNMSAFFSEAKYADQGIALVSMPPQQPWCDHYELCLGLHKTSFEHHYSYGDFERSLADASAVRPTQTPGWINYLPTIST